MTMLLVWLVTVLVKAALLAGVMLLKRMAKVPVQNRYTAEELEQFYRQNRPVELAHLPVFLVLVPLSAVVWMALLTGVCNYRFSLMPSHLLLVRLRPEWLIWGVPGMMLGIFTTGWLVDLAHKWLFDEAYLRKWQAASDHRMKYDSVRLMRWMMCSVSALTFIMLVLQLDTYTRLNDDRLVINPCFGFRESVYRYEDIRDLVSPTHLIAPNGDLVERTRQVVIFSDGTQWHHDGLLRDPQPLIAILEAKTGKKFRTVQFMEDALK